MVLLVVFPSHIKKLSLNFLLVFNLLFWGRYRKDGGAPAASGESRLQYVNLSAGLQTCIQDGDNINHCVCARMRACVHECMHVCTFHIAVIPFLVVSSCGVNKGKRLKKREKVDGETYSTCKCRYKDNA